MIGMSLAVEGNTINQTPCMDRPGVQHRARWPGRHGNPPPQPRQVTSRADTSSLVWHSGPVRLSYEPYYFSERTVFFSHNKSANSTFSHGFSAKQTEP